MEKAGPIFPLWLRVLQRQRGCRAVSAGQMGFPRPAWDESWREATEVGAWGAWVELLGTNTVM